MREKTVAIALQNSQTVCEEKRGEIKLLQQWGEIKIK